MAIAGVAFDVERARREYLKPGCVAESHDLLRLAKGEGLKARLSRSSVGRIQTLSLSVIAKRVEVLVISVFIQPVALVSPLADVALNRLRIYAFAHPTSRMDAAGLAAVPSSRRASDRLLREPRRRACRCPRARVGDHPPVRHLVRADAGARRRVRPALSRRRGR
ncbi:hypothetical protein ACQR1Y_24455 [Bradyrhizobium sp. HKCCYLRH3099]|uniref:hypothetical protein n=1 Tax=unclassified Bradyrhizobium TaxID=2631580 RepID=UPI003EBDC83B